MVAARPPGIEARGEHFERVLGAFTVMLFLTGASFKELTALLIFPPLV